MKIGLIGVGIVGGALKRWFEDHTKHELFIYDPGKGHTQDLSEVEATFISVPVPTLPSRRQDLSILAEAISRCPASKPIFIRSTVLPGTCDYFARDGRAVYHLPEFLTERTADKDMSILPIVCGGGPYDHYAMLLAVFPGKKIVCMSNVEAELTKYAHNCYGAYKVSYFNLIRAAADRLGASYTRVLEGAGITGFINAPHTQVPGPDGKPGYGGHCLPKDLAAFLGFLTDNGLSGSELLASVEAYNHLIRKEDHPWTPRNLGSQKLYG
jgi:UDPglucose 6-dehydrogenase